MIVLFGVGLTNCGKLRRGMRAHALMLPNWSRRRNSTMLRSAARIGLGTVGQRVMVVGWVKRGDDIHTLSFRKANARETKRYQSGACSGRRRLGGRSAAGPIGRA